MIKVFAFLTRLPTLSDEQFHAHWRDPHGTLTRRMPQITRYVQNHQVDAARVVPGIAPCSYSGVATVWFTDLGKMVEMQSDPRYQPLYDDGFLLYEQSLLAWLVADEVVVRDYADATATGSPAKALVMAKRHPALSTADFESRLAALDAGLLSTPGIAGYKRSTPHAAALGGQPPLFDAVLEFLYDTSDALAAAWGGPQSPSRALAPLLDAAGTTGLAAREERVIWPD